MNKTVVELKNKVSFGIITFKEEELNALVQRFQPWELVSGGRHAYIYSKLRVDTGREYSITIVRCLEQGQVAAQQTTNDLIEDLNPQWLLLVGIAGGVPAEEYTLGDVLLASRLHDFSVSAAVEGQETESNVAGGPIHREIAKLLGVIPAYKNQLNGWNTLESITLRNPHVEIPDDLNSEVYYGDNTWRAKVRSTLLHNFPKDLQPRTPIFRVGSVASSNTLVKDTQLLNQWRSSARAITHVEMELGGVYEAARRIDRTYPILAIRGISDIVGYKRSREWTEYACQSAAAFTYKLLHSGLIDLDQRTVSSEVSPIAVSIQVMNNQSNSTASIAVLESRIRELESSLTNVNEEIQALRSQYDNSIDEGDRVRIRRKIESRTQERDHLAQEIDTSRNELLSFPQ